MKLTNIPLLLFVTFVFSYIQVAFSQNDIGNVLNNWNAESIPYIYPKNISEQDSILYLDTREREEYNVSHLKNAIWVGYKKFDATHILTQVPNKNQPIIVYCSIGVRSEDIGEELKSLGYTKVLNLHGGIFNWKNQDRQVYNLKEKPTDSVHAFSKHWGKLLEKGVKVY